MKKNFRLFFDMDNTLADFSKSINESKNLYESMYEEGFFLNMKPLPFLEEINKLASLCPENVYVISACIDSKYCKNEKILWLKKYLPSACKENVIFTNVGQNKVDYINKKTGKTLSKYDILIDDYSKNVFDWETAGGTAVKFKNSFNTSDPTKYKYIIKDFSELFELIERLRLELD